jgi:hypothetical protein
MTLLKRFRLSLRWRRIAQRLAALGEFEAAGYALDLSNRLRTA